MNLFWIEFKKVILSIPFVIFLVAVVLFNFTQYHQDIEKIEPPEPNLEQYGYMQKDDPSIIMPRAMERLAMEIAANTFVAYPLSFYKEVTLSKEKLKRVNELAQSLKSDMVYQDFKEIMQQINVEIGGGSSYGDQALVREFGYVEMTYEDAVEEYERVVKNDQYTAAYARYFADYLGILLAILPAFIAVAISLKDNAAQMTSLIYSRSISSTRLIITRITAIVTALFLPILLLSVYETTVIYSMYPGEVLKPFAFISYSVGWLLPTILFVVALALCITEWTGSLIAIAVQLVMFFVSLQMGMTQLQGGYGQGMMNVRHNIIGATETFMQYKEALFLNRLGYVTASFVFIILTVWGYEHKRKGMPTRYERLQQFWKNRHR